MQEYLEQLPIEQSFLLCKPDTLQCGAFEDSLQVLHNDGLAVTSVRYFEIDEQGVAELYPERMDGYFCDEIRWYMTSGACALVLVEGEDAIHRVLDLKGKTYRGGLRGKYALSFVINSFHCPDSGLEYESHLDILKKYVT